MALVKIENMDGVEIITSEFTRVPNVGEQIVFDYLDDVAGTAGSGTVQHVTWYAYKANQKPVDVVIAVRTCMDHEDIKFMQQN